MENEKAVLKAKNTVLDDYGLPKSEKEGSYTKKDGEELDTVDLVYETEEGYQILQVSTNSPRFWWKKNENGGIKVFDSVQELE